MNRKRINLIVSLVVGGLLFLGVLNYYGVGSLLDVYENINLIYLIPFLFLTTFVFFINAWRLQVVLSAYNEKASFWALLRQNIAGWAVSAVTPSAKIGGEPLKVYMLKKENNIGWRNGSSAVLMDKFIELFGSLFFGLLGLTVLFLVPGMSIVIKSIVAIVMLISFSVLAVVYYMTVRGKGPFTNLFTVLRFYRIPRFKKLKGIVRDIEKKMAIFFIHHKKEFLLGFIGYIIYGCATYWEFKFLLMMFGIDLGFFELIIVVVVWGIVNLAPVPVGLGFHEITQSGLFAVMQGSGSTGLAFTLLVRLRTLFFIALGFAIISHFTGGEVMKKYNGNDLNKNVKKKPKKKRRKKESRKIQN